MVVDPRIFQQIDIVLNANPLLYFMTARLYSVSIVLAYACAGQRFHQVKWKTLALEGHMRCC